MGDKRRLILVCVVAAALVAVVGLGRVMAVRSAERVVAAQTKIVLEVFEARQGEMFKNIVSGAPATPSMLKIDESTLNAAERVAGSVNMTGAFFAALTLLIACAAVANETQGIWPPVIMGVYGWLVSAYTVALSLQYGVALFAGLTRDAALGSPNPLLSIDRLPFAFMFLAGLAATFLWQAALPCALGTFVGLRLRVWRLSSDFVGPYHEVASDAGGDSTRGIGVPARGASATETGGD